MKAQNFEVNVYHRDRIVETFYIEAQTRGEAEQEAKLAMKGVNPDLFNNTILIYEVKTEFESLFISGVAA